MGAFPASARLTFRGVLSTLACVIVFAPRAYADPPPTFVNSWPPNPNEYPTTITKASDGHLIVGLQLFSTQGLLNEYDQNGPGGGAGFPWLTMPPTGIAVDVRGFVYVAFTRCNCVQKLVDPVVTWGDTGTAPGQFDRLTRIAIDADGYVYAADRNNHRIQKLTLDGAPVAEWGTYGRGPGQLGWPYGIAVDGGGHVYVTDYLNDKVQKYTTSGVFVTEWGDSGAALGQFDQPTGISADGHGGVFVADQRNQRIQKFTDQGALLVSWGEPDSLSGIPTDVAADGQGGVWVADPFNGVFKFRESTTTSVQSTAAPRLELELTPNPFRDHLTLRWSQPIAGITQVALEDVTGRRIATLASGQWSAGRHELTWSPVLGLERVPAGIYWIRVRTSDREAARSVVHVR